MDMYYRLLNCGYRLPATAGTASGIMPNPLGYNRVYAKLDGPFSYDAWFEAVRKGRTFATNGPIMEFTVNGLLAGSDFDFPDGQPASVEVDIEVASVSPLEKVEIIQNGMVIATGLIEGKKRATLKKSVTFKRSGWVAARCFEINKKTERCAHTSPVYIHIGDAPIASKKDAEYFIAHMDELIAEAKASTEFANEEQR